VHRDDGTGVREIEPIERLLQNATGVVDINRTTRGRRTRNRLRHKKQLVNRVELDISTTEDLLFPAIGQNFCKSGLRGQIIDFDAGIIFCRRTGKIVRRIDCDAVYKSKSDAGEFRERALCEIYQPKQPSPPPRTAVFVTVL
jgi:hypothetical protein